MRPSGRNKFNKGLPEFFPENAQEALADGWVVEGIYPRPDMRYGIHAYWMDQGYYVADMGFTRSGKLVPPGQYVLWIKKRTDLTAVA